MADEVPECTAAQHGGWPSTVAQVKGFMFMQCHYRRAQVCSISAARPSSRFRVYACAQQEGCSNDECQRQRTSEELIGQGLAPRIQLECAWLHLDTTTLLGFCMSQLPELERAYRHREASLGACLCNRELVNPCLFGGETSPGGLPRSEIEGKQGEIVRIGHGQRMSG